MKLSRIIILVVVLIVVVIIAVAAYSALVAPPANTAWKAAAEFPVETQDTFGVSGQQCINSTVYIYCIGGQDYLGGPHNSVYTSSPISSTANNITSWTPDPSSAIYPTPIYAQSCVANSGYIYCVGGTYDDGGDDVNSSYYATLSSNGVVGTWTKTTEYPAYIDSQYCVASSGYIYCVGGFTESNGLNATSAPSNSVWYAPISSSGIGTWSSSASYPSGIYAPSCFGGSGYIYCVGGIDGNGNPLDDAYYATLNSTGVGTWTQTTTYQFQGIGQACAVSSGYIYCVGGEESGGYTNAVYYAPASSGGIGTWSKAPNYPDSVWTTCAILSGDMYCFGGVDGSSAGESGATYYAPLTALLGLASSS